MRLLIASILLVFTPLAAQASGDPFAARVLFDDVDRFYKMFDAANGKPTADQVRRDYIEAGSPGVRDFIPSRIQSPEALAAKIAADRGLYERARRCQSILPKVERRMRASYLAFQWAYPEARLPDTTILIGRGNSGGTAKASGVLVGIEVMCDLQTGSMPVEIQLSNLIAHELVHTQKDNFRGNTLLAAALNEGVADFIGELISGAPVSTEIYAIADSRAAEIELAFAKEMNGTDKSRWLYNGPGTPEWPRDLGYWAGYRIAKSFYDRSQDKRAAIRTMLKSTDAQEFLALSGWAPAAQ